MTSDDERPRPDNRGKASSPAWSEPGVRDDAAGPATGEARGTGPQAPVSGCSRHGHVNCTACAELLRLCAERDHYRARAFAAEARLAASDAVERNLDTLYAMLITDPTGYPDCSPGYTRDRETMLLRAARVLREARRGAPLAQFMATIGDLYAPEE